MAEENDTNIETESNTNEDNVYGTHLTLGGKNIANISTICNETTKYGECPNLNWVYIDAVSSNNNDRAQFKIDPQTFKLSLGKARIKHQTGDWSGQIKQYDIFVQAQTLGSGNSTGGGENVTFQGVTSIKGGYGIKVDDSDVNSPVLSIDETILPIGSDSFLNHQIRQLLQVFQVIYGQCGQQVYKTLQSVESIYGNNSQEIKMAAFSFIPDSSYQQFNCLKIKTELTQLSQQVFCSIRKCNEVKQSGGPGYSIQNIQQFLKDSQLISVSNNTGQFSESYIQWNFSKKIKLQQGQVYLVMFSSVNQKNYHHQNDKNIKTRITTAAAASSTRKLCWGLINGTDDTIQGSPYMQMCNKKPIGAKFK